MIIDDALKEVHFISENIIEFLKNQALRYSKAAKQAIQEADKYKGWSYIQRVEYIQQRTDELLGDYHV